MVMMRPLLMVAAIVYLVAMTLAAPATAHAYIMQTAPVAGATLTQAPKLVSIQFDEPVNLPDGPAIEVLDAAGRRVDANDAAIDPNDVTTVITHLPRLTPGSYSVRWRVISADTHVVHGTFTFGYGAAAGTATSAGDTLFDPSAPLASIARWLSLTGILAAAGAAFFGILFRPDARAFAAAANRQIRYGCALALLANAVLFVVQSAASAGTLSGGATPVALFATLHSSFGLDWLVRIVAIAVLWACSASRNGIAGAIGACAAIATLTTLTFGGHAAGLAAQGPPLAMPIIDWLHLLATSAWLGGLGVLTAGLFGSPQISDADRRAWLARFTKLAIPAVIVMLFTGWYASLAHEPNLWLLLTTRWGTVLVIKVVLVLILLAFGGQSLLAGQGRIPISSRILVTELALAVIVLLATGVLVGQALPMCMSTPAGAARPSDAKMPPGMQMCQLSHRRLQGVVTNVS
jgi:copper transport protein